MWFKKNNVKTAFQSFQFLIDYGFSMVKYLRAPDEERVYTKGAIVVEVLYTLGMFPDGKTSMCVDVIITIDGKSDNLLKCNNIFSNDLLETLKNSVDAVTPLEQIPIYAHFVKTNIDTLLQHVNRQ